MSGRAGGAPGIESRREPVPALKPPRTPVSCEDAETLHEVLKRQILAERHEMDLVVAVEHLALVADREQAVIDARRDEAILRVAFLDNSPEPTSKLVPSGKTSPMAVSACEDSASRKGTAVSGQTTSEMPSSLPAAARLVEIEIVVEDLGAVLRSPFIGLIDIGLHDAEAHAGGRRICALKPRRSPRRAEREQEEKRA